MEPLKIAIYFGYPSYVNHSVYYENIISAFSPYDMVVFSDYHDDKNINFIIRDLLKTRTYSLGYVNMRLTRDKIKDKIKYWSNCGTYGIYIDNCGYDSSINRLKQNNIISFIHNLNMIVMARCKNPNDIIDDNINIRFNPLGINSLMNRNDWFMYEGFQISNGEYEIANEWRDKCNKLVKLKKKYDFNIACMATNSNIKNITESDADYSYLSAVLYNFDAWGYGEYMYSKDSDYLPYIKRKLIYGTKFIGKVDIENGIIKRKMNIGININTNNKSTNIIIDKY